MTRPAAIVVTALLLLAPAPVRAPVASIGAGGFVGRPRLWGQQQPQDYPTNRYHRAADEYIDTWDLRGAMQFERAAREPAT